MGKSILKKCSGFMLMLLWLTPGIVHGTTAGQFRSNEDSSNIKSFFLQVQQAYEKAAYLGFRVKYLYTNAGNGERPMDSISGNMEMDKGRCRFVLAGNETLATGKYLIQVSEEERTIYLSGKKQQGSINPVELLDSTFQQMKDLHGTVSVEGQLKVLVLDFPPGKQYTQIRMEIDRSTGYFRRIIYSLHTAGLVEQEMIGTPGHPAPYRSEGHVDMLFYDYQLGKFGDNVFDEGNFFTRVGNKFQAAGQYRDYHIYLANSNL